MLFFLKGLIIGFCIAAPVGPIGILCIRRTLHAGRWAGLFSGLGAASADAVYGMVAAFSLTTVTEFLIDYQFYFRCAGGLFLLYLGFKTFREKPKVAEAAVQETTRCRDFTSTFLLTLTNPMTIFSFMAIFAGLGLVSGAADYRLASLLVLGVFAGSLVWWVFLAELVSFFRKRVTQKLMVGINRLSGGLIFAFGLAAIYSLI